MPSGLGFTPAVIEGVKGLCFEAVHTHDETGILHIDVVEGNDLNLGNFIRRWLPDLNLTEAKIRVNGAQVEDLAAVTLRPEMDIKIFLGEH